jgi:starvation-inducible DNA-binding protein
MQSNIGISSDVAYKSCTDLKVLLANETALSLYAHAAHWNVEGADFYSAHLFFDTLYNDFLEYIDGIAERIRMLGQVVPVTFSAYKGLITVEEPPMAIMSSQEFISGLLTNLEKVIVGLRKSVNAFATTEAGTSNFMLDLLEKHEKTAWFLRSHLSAKEVKTSGPTTTSRLLSRK